MLSTFIAAGVHERCEHNSDGQVADGLREKSELGLALVVSFLVSFWTSKKGTLTKEKGLKSLSGVSQKRCLSRSDVNLPPFKGRLLKVFRSACFHTRQ